MVEYRELFEKIPDGVTLHEAADGAILDANEQFCDMLGYTREELLDLDFAALHVDEPPYTSERAAELIKQAATEGPQTFEWRDITKDGDPVPVEVNLRRTAIDGEDRILAVVRDITERKQQERELERKTERLEAFASLVSHDLRNPLSVFEGRLRLAREDCDSAHFEPMARAVDRMNQLIDDLLAMARDGNGDAAAKPVDLMAVAESSWQNVPTADATLAIDADCRVTAVPSLLRQVFENLFRNAIEHGGADVTVTVGQLNRGSGFYVEDDGPGIGAVDPSEVFDPAYSTSDDGAGIGLSIVREAVERHGWEIQVTDGSGGGARFEISNIETAPARG